MNTAEIIGIFPTPIYTNKLDREFTKKEINFFAKEKEKKFKNVGNNSSSNNYILNNTELKNLKQELDEIVKDYFKKIISIDEKASPYITQSWLNWTSENEFHHRHSHSNSIVSGVIHNPHYYDFIRNGGGGGRNNADIPCGGLPDLHILRNNLNRVYDVHVPTYLYKIHQCITHIQHFELVNHVVENHIVTNRNLRIKYMMNEISENDLKTVLQQNEK